MKRLKNIEGKNKEQLEAVKNKEKKNKSVIDIFDEEPSQEIKNLLTTFIV